MMNINEAVILKDTEKNAGIKNRIIDNIIKCSDRKLLLFMYHLTRDTEPKKGI